ncbi:MAG: hypothetical protein AAGA20_05570 [Planctomycetota bacterium]
MRLHLPLALLLAPAAVAQSDVPIRVEGTVFDLLNGTSTSFPGVTIGAPVTLDVVVQTPGTPAATGQGIDYVGDEATFSVTVGTESSGSEPGFRPQALVIADPTIAALGVGGSLANGGRVVLALLDFTSGDVFQSDNLTALFGSYEPSSFDSLTFEILGPDSLDRIQISVDSVSIGITAGIGEAYCGPAVPNVSGASASIFALGSNVVADNDLTLSAISLPANTFSFFLASRDQNFVPNPSGSVGTLCLGGSIGRFVGPGEIQNAGISGEVSLSLDLNRIPQPTGFTAVTAGETWNFQAWYRDTANGAPTSNFTNGVSVGF